MNRIFLLGSTLIILGGLSCRDEPVAPPPTEPPTGKRDFVWSIDSVDYGSLPSKIELECLWGSSATDVWGVAGNAPDVRDCLWHYDGVKWTRATEGTPITEFTGNKTLHAVWGAARNDVWAVGRKVNQGVLSSFLMHYDGTHWIDATPPNISTLHSILYNVYGLSKSDIWVGAYEYALHYDGSVWSAYKVADSLTIGRITGINDVVILHLSSPWGGRDVFLYEFNLDDSTFRIVDQTTLTQAKFGGRPWIVSNTIYSLSNGILSTDITDTGRIDTSGWKRELTTNSYLTERYVITPNDVFTVGQYNLIYHFNGMDWTQILIEIPNHTVDPLALFWGVWGNGQEVFICDWQNGIVYHGR